MAPWIVWILPICTVLTGQGIKALDCGVAPLNTRVVGGDNATPGSWPWQVSIHVNYLGTHICGGTLISDQWVLTAAHCIVLNDPRGWKLYFGRNTQAGPNVNEVSRTVTKVIVHSNYNDTLYNNDIALMRLSSPVTYTNYIRPICLASSSSQFHNGTSCWATGWGDIRASEPLPNNVPLQEVKIPIIGNKQCTCNYIPAKEATITSNMVCAGQENKGICQGDSGGPLQCKQGSSWIQAGLSSFGVPCALAGFPEVFARVSQYETWIKESVGEATVGFVVYNSSGTDPDNSFVCDSASSPTLLKFSTQFTFVSFATVMAHHIFA
ncbi:prostasin [Cololabis saira]|uniref:prostasin n=1 Tax=Cololabis saira TaxID=129043 RepID=UPI002AD53061|nr:prostasin [Cololabis saira]